MEPFNDQDEIILEKGSIETFKIFKFKGLY